MNKKKVIANQVRKPDDNRSIMQIISELPKEQQTEAFETIIQKKYPDKGWEGIKYDWSLWRRADQWFDIIPSDNWKTAAWICGRGFGKGATLDTLIPTPSGWTTMGEITVGDKVFDEKGNICNVTGVTDVYIPEKAYRLHFSDHSSLDVCDQHQFITWTHSDRKAYLRKEDGRYNLNQTEKFPNDWVNWKKTNHKKASHRLDKDLVEMAIKENQETGVSGNYLSKKYGLNRNSLYPHLRNEKYIEPEVTQYTNENIGPRIRTTQEIVDSFYQGKRKDLNHCIPLAGALKLESCDLPIDSYLYGMFLGDGCIKSGVIASHLDDYLFYKEYISNLGFEVRELKIDKRSVSQKSGCFSIAGFRKVLNDAKTLKSKKIIPEYLRASEEQRMQTLRGCLDTDGTIGKNGDIEFTNTNKEIADFVIELLLTVGQKPTVSTKIGTLYGVPKKLVYRVRFHPTRPDFFNLPRKLDRVKDITKIGQQIRNCHRMIVAYEEIEPTKMKCIQVDSANSMYLIGKNFIPSHNTRTATEIVRYLAENKLAKRIGIVAPTAHDATAVFLEGQSGLLTISPPWFKPSFHPTYKKITWPGNETVAYTFSAEDPESLRGHQFDWVIGDELAAWSKGLKVWEQIVLINRLGSNPRKIITTTPKSNELIRSIVGNPTTWTITGSTQENADNIAVDEMVTLFEGTRLGKQELHGEILEQVEGALWKQEWIEKGRVHVKDTHKLPEFLYIVMAIDPAMTANKNSDETGIAICAYGTDDKYYLLYADGYKETPHEWARRALDLYDAFSVTSIVVETNQGGDLVLQNLQRIRPDIFVTPIHAKKGKALRAEPVAHMYELGKVCHYGIHLKAEDQMTNFNPLTNLDGKDDIVDSICYSILALMEKAMVNAVYRPAVGGLRHKLLNYRAR